MQTSLVVGQRVIRRSSWTMVVATLLLTMVSSSASVLMTDGRAEAAGCFADTCEGKWPGEENCLGSKVEVTAYDFEGPWTDDDRTEPVVVGRATLFYSGQCRATWAEWVVTLDLDDDQISYPQLWTQAQYGGRSYLPAGSVDGMDGRYNVLKVSEDPDIYRSAMASWNSSVRMCSVPWALDAEPPGEPMPEDRFYTCTDWL